MELIRYIDQNGVIRTIAHNKSEEFNKNNDELSDATLKILIEEVKASNEGGLSLNEIIEIRKSLLKREEIDIL